MIGNPETGILTLLDDETKLKTSENFASVIYKKIASSALVRSYSYPSTFTVRHYVCDVTYDSENFVEKNTEAISESVLRLAEVCLRKISGSELTLVKPGKRFVSEGLQSKQQLESLLKTLDNNVKYLFFVMR